MKKLGIILFLLGCFFTGISQQKIIIRGAGAIDTTGKFVYDVFLSNDSLFYSKGGNNVYIGKLIAVTDDSLQTVMRRSSVLTESSSIVNNTPNEPYYNITMDTAGSKVAYDNLSLKFGHELVWIGGGDSASIVNIGNNGIQGVVIKNSGNSAEFRMTNSSEDIGLITKFNGLSQYNEATVPSGNSAPGVFHLKTETGAHYAFPRSKPTLNQILKVTDTTTYPDMQVLSWVDGIDSLKVDSVKVYSSTCVDTFKYWVSGTPTTIATVDKQNGLNSGGVVTPAATDTTFDVTAAVYKILCTRYASAAALVTLNGNSDSSKGRIDVIGVNTSGVAFGLQGTNATNPIAPALSATQLGLATVTFPPLSDSGIVNIYNNFDFNGIDSSAYRQVATTPDSLCFIFTSLLRSDTICSTRSTLIDSLRRLAGSVNVEARKGGVWITQYQDSVGSGGGGGVGTLQQVLTTGSTLTTDNTIDVDGNQIFFDDVVKFNAKSRLAGSTFSEMQVAQGEFFAKSENATVGTILNLSAGLGYLSNSFGATDTLKFKFVNPPIRSTVDYFYGSSNDTLVKAQAVTISQLTDSLNILRDSLAAYRAQDTVYTESGIQTVYSGDSTKIRLPYKSYVALLSQSGTDAPTAIVLQNDFDGNIIWARSSTGNYTATLSGAFTENKSWCVVNNTNDAADAGYFSLRRVDSDSFIMSTFDISVTNVDDLLINTSVEIRVYY